MQMIENDLEGESLILVPGDRLERVPVSHRDLITPRIREVFRDPLGHFRRVADECPFPQMAAWLRTLVTQGWWYLGLHRAMPEAGTAAGFGLELDGVRGAEITPAADTLPPGLPPAMRRYYSLVDQVHWMGYGCAGGLSGSEQAPLSAHPFEWRGATIDPSETFVFGWSPCGAMLIYTSDGRGGWATFDGLVHLLGSIEETIDWVFGELRADRCPDFDYGWAA